MRLFCYTNFLVNDANKNLFLEILAKLSDFPKQYSLIAYFQKEGCYGLVIEGDIEPKIVMPQLEEELKKYNDQIEFAGAVSWNSYTEEHLKKAGISHLVALSKPAFELFVQTIKAALGAVRSKYAQMWEKIQVVKQTELAEALKELESKVKTIKLQGNSSYHSDYFGSGSTPHSSNSFNQLSSPSYSNSQFSIDSFQTQQKQKIEQQNQKVRKESELHAVEIEKSNASVENQANLLFIKMDLDNALKREIELIEAFASKVTEKFNNKEISEVELASIWSTELLMEGQILQQPQVSVTESTINNGNVTFTLTASDLIKLNFWLNQNPKLEIDAQLFAQALEKSMGMRPKQISYDHQKQKLTFEINCNVTSGSEPYFIEDIQKTLFLAGLVVAYFVSSVSFVIKPVQVETVKPEPKPVVEQKPTVNKQEILNSQTKSFFGNAYATLNSKWIKMHEPSDEVVLALPNQFASAATPLAVQLTKSGFWAIPVVSQTTGEHGVVVNFAQSEPQVQLKK